MSETMRSLMKTAEASNMLAEEATRKVVEVMKENARLRALVASTQEKCAQVADERAKRCRAYALEVWDDTLRQREAVAAAECMSVAAAIRSLNLTEIGP